ncbi:unnamed protein product [Microthlaspi erraticum]|uniref:Uncharacterized protein n=1 Tax=Microthlaspi erraticum TaxID=1685480 RepID=A0A6D2KN66_9BRAS|nr:unnamed protein product [Microthlaspi erraticum]CAA7029581.1 unnamed protein product [Microthlaspi erraticum]CAA7029588.1 unnamed protein product [Microthlaspi erraticum]CAA7054760.1 unnamed protein product [Microthlaspi erraticum]
MFYRAEGSVFSTPSSLLPIRLTMSLQSTFRASQQEQKAPALSCFCSTKSMEATTEESTGIAMTIMIDQTYEFLPSFGS